MKEPWYWKQVKGMGADCFIYSANPAEPSYHDYCYIATASGFGNLDRICECVNALEDVENPESTIKFIRKALRETIDHYRKNTHGFEEDPKYIQACKVALLGLGKKESF